MEIRNFGANVVFQPRSYFAPRSEHEVLDILRACRGRQIRVAGRLHSWSEAARGDDVLLDLKYLDAIAIEERDDGPWATIGGGCQIKRVVSELDRRAGVTLPSLGLITEQSIAGAISTGTHGSGKNSLSHYVEEMSLATYDAASGEPVIVRISAGPELLAARCSLGCLGVILSVGMRCRDQYRLEEHFRLYDSCRDALAEEKRFPLQQLFLVPFLWKCLAQHRREVDDKKRSFLAPLYRLYWFLGIDLALHLILLTTTRFLRARWLQRFLYRWIVPLSVPRGWKVVDKSQHILTMEHELFRHIEIEVFVRGGRVAEALQFTQQLLQYTDGAESAIAAGTWARLDDHGLSDAVRAMLGSYTHHYPICVRKVLPDETLMSMASGDDESYYSVSFINYNRPKERSGFFEFAELLAKTTALLYQARPHWGKVCPIDSDLVADLYPNLSQFRRICAAYDPDGVFRNPWIDNLMF